MKIPQLDPQNEKYHLGHLFMDTMRSRPDAICQLDAATGQSETNASVLSRSVQLAKCLRHFGAKPGDVLALGGTNHLDLHIPHYAALMNGMPIAGVDPLFKCNDIKVHFSLCEPKVAFCQKELLGDYLKAIKELGLDTRVICFDEGAYSMKKFIQEFDKDDVEEFAPAIFDLDKIYACLISSGGTTGVMKLIAFKHRLWVNKFIELRAVFQKTAKNTTDENKPALNVAPVQWISGFLNSLAMPLLHMIKIQTSGPRTTEHLIDVINKYKPKSVLVTSILLNSIFEEEKECDFSCFDSLMVGGTKIPKDGHIELKKRMRPDAVVIETYGQTENMGPVFMPVPRLPVGSCGNGKYSWHKVKLVDIKTGEEITKPNVPGEMLTKGPCFSEYYNNPELTASMFTNDGWYKTGDLLYIDEHDNYYFVERIQMMINGQVRFILPSAPDIEEVIRSHPGVRDVCVTTVRASDVDQHPVACVVRRPGSAVTAQEIKDLVAGKLPESQRLRGGVVFMSQIPTTSAGKIARAKLNHMVFTARRE
ncbi:luciferin 4-monooxygenase-like [Anticarsia gemmatalis]|uniref:luciferin 4-monooxygenase-like n=1 Tax=Anticarsia gemmatalis TaxID=129554 RepID=UPI003F763F24